MRVDRLHRLEQLAGARVRGLAAVHDAMDAEVLEDRGEALARGDGDDRERGPHPRSGRRRSGVPRLRQASAAAPCSSPSVANAAARGLADVARLLVEVLDA